MADSHSELILVTGATGYVGGRLVPRLLGAGYRVRCLARDPARLAGRPWPGAEIVAGDVLAARDAAARHGRRRARHITWSIRWPRASRASPTGTAQPPRTSQRRPPTQAFSASSTWVVWAKGGWEVLSRSGPGEGRAGR